MTKIPLKVFQNLRAGDQKQYITNQPQQNIFANWIYIIFEQYHFTITNYKEIILINFPIKVI